MTNVQPHFGRLLREERQAVKLTVRGLARVIGVQACYISQVERGKCAPPSAATIIRWAKALGLPPDYILSRAGKVAPDVQEIIIERAIIFPLIIRKLNRAEDVTLRNVLHILRRV